MLTAALLAAFAAGLLVGVLLDMVDDSYGLASLDDNLARWGVANAESVTVEILRVLTYLGDTAVLLAVAGHRGPMELALAEAASAGRPGTRSPPGLPAQRGGEDSGELA